ncbi:hypothetical protein QAD02_005460 [Eretmocerus hayati]|uniref:Uncharacterized protein n=1 Tax=Eretmocerus hayati TaxID=131215 RepID=A0ACC2NSK7_9HYME|nr:hypothetical protein QAD02_005460 [Eretmocerus hayati]
MSANIRKQIRNIIPKAKREQVLSLFYKGLDFHPLDGPDDEKLHVAVFEMISLYLKDDKDARSNSSSTIGPVFNPLHLAINVVLYHENEESVPDFFSKKSKIVRNEESMSKQIRLKFHVSPTI